MDKIKHDWWVKIEGETHTPTYMECSLCGKQVKWWQYHGEVKLENPFKEGDDHEYCLTSQ